MPEATALRKLSYTSIDYIVHLRNFWSTASESWHPGSAARPAITESDVQYLYKISDVLTTAGALAKHVVSGNTMRVYTNDINILHDVLAASNNFSFITFTEAAITQPRDSVCLVDPQHQYRSYFKQLSLTVSEKTNIVNFLINQQPNIRLSPGLTQWLTFKYNHSSAGAYFFDYNDTGMAVLLSLINPRLLRKTLKIMKA
jgi:hypothetical protein